MVRAPGGRGFPRGADHRRRAQGKAALRREPASAGGVLRRRLAPAGRGDGQAAPGQGTQLQQPQRHRRGLQAGGRVFRTGPGHRQARQSLRRGGGRRSARRLGSGAGLRPGQRLRRHRRHEPRARRRHRGGDCQAVRRGGDRAVGRTRRARNLEEENRAADSGGGGDARSSGGRHDGQIARRRIFGADPRCRPDFRQPAQDRDQARAQPSGDRRYAVRLHGGQARQIQRHRLRQGRRHRGRRRRADEPGRQRPDRGAKGRRRGQGGGTERIGDQGFGGGIRRLLSLRRRARSRHSGGRDIRDPARRFGTRQRSHRRRRQGRDRDGVHRDAAFPPLTLAQARRKSQSAMRGRDMALAAFTSVIWGFAFPAIKIALVDFSAPQLTALRFIVAALPVFLLSRPRVSWQAVVLIGLTLFTGQFLLMFFSYELGMPPGLASVTQQIQVFFTVLLAAIFLGDHPTRRQIAGMAVAFAGLALIALTTGGDLRPAALGLALGAALSWSVGNVLVKRADNTPIFALLALAISAAVDKVPVWTALAHASWPGLLAVVYLGAITTNVGYAAWGHLLQRYKAGVVAPFALLSPCTGILASAWLFGEVFPAARYAGMALILAGLAVILLPGAKPPVQTEPFA